MEGGIVQNNDLPWFQGRHQKISDPLIEKIRVASALIAKWRQNFLITKGRHKTLARVTFARDFAINFCPPRCTTKSVVKTGVNPAFININNVF